MKINSDDLRVKAGKDVNLERWPTIIKPVYESKGYYDKLLQEHGEQR